jgi:hypothetical protein
MTERRDNMFGREDESARLFRAHLDDSSMGMGMGDYHDKVRDTISRLNKRGYDLRNFSHYDIRRIALDPDFKFEDQPVGDG